MRDEEILPATAVEIRQMVGDVDDAVVSSIMQTGASAADVSLAVQWLRGGGPEDEAGYEPHGAAKAVYDILQVEEPQEP